MQTFAHPGVYIQEVPSGVRTIIGVSTSVAAFLGYFKRGVMNKAVEILSLADFDREFGGLDARSEASYAIGQFFLNGGTQAWVVRVAKGGTAVAAAITLMNAAPAGTAAGTPLLLATAVSPGAWGNNVRIDLDYATVDPNTSFNLVVTEVSTGGGRTEVLATETFRNLVLDPTSPSFAVDVVNDRSALVRLALVGTPNPTARPAQTGTISNSLATVPPDLARAQLDVSLNTEAAQTVTLGERQPATLAELAAELQTGIRGMKGLNRVTVSLLGSASTQQFLQIKAGTDNPSDVLTFKKTVAERVGLDNVTRSNVQQYVLGAGAKAAQALPKAQSGPDKLQTGADGDPPDGTALSGNQAAKSGLFALEDVPIFNLLCIPDTMLLVDTEAAAVAAAAEGYCEQRRAFYLLDVPQKDVPRDNVDAIRTWLDQNATLRHRNAALYFPRPQIADPLNEFRLRPAATSGTVAGIYARTDATSGVSTAPAGTVARLQGVQRLEYLLTDAENGVLNPLAINCLRSFPISGLVAWGARTLDGADAQASEWKYVPVRRLALFIEDSLYRGLQFAVFQPNDEPLWADIRLNGGVFMNTLFRQGAFQGRTPQEAYLVKCDKETTTQADIDRGVVNVLVGFAPLKPAEFVVLRIQQLAGQLQT